MKPAQFTYERPKSLQDAIASVGEAEANAKVVAGAQSLGPMLNLRLARPGKLVDIRTLPELRAVQADSKSFSIGATLTHAEIEDGSIEDFTRGLLPFVAHGIAYRAVRNRGTVGGSLAHADPAADWVSTMAAIGATIVIRGPSGERRVAAQDFLIGAFTSEVSPTEILTAVELPRLSAAAQWGYYKICRKTGEFAKAIGVSIQDQKLGLFRILAGSTEGRPLLLVRSAEALASRGPDQAASLVRDEIEDTLNHIEPAHRQQLVIAVQRSLQKASLKEAA
ncbi:carbon-monoxide dehydrogenase medium subunit [Bradyrhizobium diazoefficiens]|uniref:FAD binding domain-containing protein n=1 Tax=Bradyrhizobium TaxID=374 RepID=UPI000D7363D6|nr:FAD binding domain-containing protein [Bradyrhizobium diazoefficiens]AWO93261.1 carbon monoxide dehydrogenase [Bradyrhizobium diazoefficiens]